jgi:outer membrane protease
MLSNAGELFGRIDSPWNLFVKGFGGGSWINGGHMNDEDFLLDLTQLDLTHPYSNTLASSVKGDAAYGAIDAGFNVLRGPGYKVGLFGGYFLSNENMKAFGCTPVASDNCIVPVPTSGAANITEKDRWRAARVGVAAETMITDRLKIGGEVAYLPWVSFNGVDHHFFGNSGILAEEFPESGNGRGVQIDALVSYYLTPQWSIGVGGRYWGLWTSSGQFNRDFPAPPTPPQFFKAQVEQAGAFVQTSYKFGMP